MVMSRRSVSLTTLILGGLRPPKLTAALLESAEGETIYVAGSGIEAETSGSGVRRATDYATRAGGVMK